MIITLHSFKGGTGKTLLTINLAAMLARAGKRVCLIELDFSAPSFFATFKSKKSYWMNDYLARACKIENVLTDCSTNDMGKGKLFVGFADPSTRAIRDMASKDRKWEIEALTRLFSLKDVLLNDMHFDYVFFDTSPGLQYSSINAIVSADLVLVVTSTDRSDVEGTKRMIRDLYELFEKKSAIIINRVPSKRCPSVKFEGCQSSPLIGEIPCSCDIAKANTEGIMAPEKLNPALAKTLQEIIDNIDHLSCSTPFLTVVNRRKSLTTPKTSQNTSR